MTEFNHAQILQKVNAYVKETKNIDDAFSKVFQKDLLSQLRFITLDIASRSLKDDLPVKDVHPDAAFIITALDQIKEQGFLS